MKVTDFGLATLSDASGFGTAGGGTIGYMPLEQMRQAVSYTHLALAVGLVLMALFVFRCIKSKNPLVDFSLFRSQPFSAGVVAPLSLIHI